MANTKIAFVLTTSARKLITICFAKRQLFVLTKYSYVVVCTITLKQFLGGKRIEQAIV